MWYVVCSVAAVRFLSFVCVHVYVCVYMCLFGTHFDSRPCSSEFSKYCAISPRDLAMGTTFWHFVSLRFNAFRFISFRELCFLFIYPLSIHPFVHCFASHELRPGTWSIRIPLWTTVYMRCGYDTVYASSCPVMLFV